MQKYPWAIIEKIRAIAKQIKKSNNLIKLSPFISFVIPVTLLYFLHTDTFEPVWTGTWENRMGYIFFLWLFSLETILNWEELCIKEFKPKSIKTVFLFLTLLLPTLYVIISNYLGLNTAIFDFVSQWGIQPEWAKLMPLSIEYLVFSVITILIIFIEQGKVGITNYSLSISFLSIIGAIYTINNLYPFGKFTPFQLLVTPTTFLASKTLNLIGYITSIDVIDNPIYGSLTILSLNGTNVKFGISWPCAGIESLLIYTITILLFLKKSSFPLVHKVIYFVIGAIVTYLINVLRVVTIFIIAVNNGNWGIFHDYFGPLYSLLWIVSYPLIIIGSKKLWAKVKSEDKYPRILIIYPFF